MQEYIYDCSYCNYSIQTKGPFPYYNEEGENVPLDNFHESLIHSAIGLMANIYCPKMR